MTRPVRSGASPRPPADDRWFSWRTLLHRNRSQRPGTMSAGMILIVMVLGLLLAMTLNADATLRKSNARGDGWRNGVASVIATISDTFQFTFLRTRVDAALGKNQGSRIDAAELVRRQQEAQAAQDAYAASRPPTIAAPTSSTPLHLWVGGDSITQTLGASLQRVLATTGVFTSTLDYHVSTGLARPDYFNWPEHLVRDVLPKDQPSVLVMMFGANDGQNMTDRQGRGLTRGSPEWLAEYRRRVAATMDLLKSPTNDRLTIWCGPPPMGPGTKVRGMDEIAHIVWSEAQTRPWIQYFDTWPFLSDDELRYVLEAPSADGQRRVLRQADDVHMSVAGADRVAWAILARIGTLIDLSSGRVAPPPGETAPASVAERREVPESMPGSE